MIDTVTPLAKHLGIEIVNPKGVLADNGWDRNVPKDAAQKALAALIKGPVLISWWSYIKYLCRDLGKTCPGGVSDFKGFDQVLTVTVSSGKVRSMKMSSMKFP